MENFHYLIGDKSRGVAMVVDPAYHLEELFAAASTDGLRVETAFFTHGHGDHVGDIDQLANLGIKKFIIHAAAHALPKVSQMGSKAKLNEDGDTHWLGTIPVRTIHTPGHQPESCCFLVGSDGAPQVLLTGDTLFVDSCGRTDFPGGNTQVMFATMDRVRKQPPDVVVLPGHDYADRPFESLKKQLVANPALATTDRRAFEKLPFLSG